MTIHSTYKEFIYLTNQKLLEHNDGHSGSNEEFTHFLFHKLFKYDNDMYVILDLIRWAGNRKLHKPWIHRTVYSLIELTIYSYIFVYMMQRDVQTDEQMDRLHTSAFTNIHTSIHTYCLDTHIQMPFSLNVNHVTKTTYTYAHIPLHILSKVNHVTNIGKNHLHVQTHVYIISKLNQVTNIGSAHESWLDMVYYYRIMLSNTLLYSKFKVLQRNNKTSKK